jgi:hypothetical protein
MTISYNLNRSAYHEVRVRGYSYGPDAEYINTKTGSYHYATYKAEKTDYYWGMITNYSSDPITIQNFSITF